VYVFCSLACACSAPGLGDAESIVFDPCEPIAVLPVDATAAEIASLEQAAGMWNESAATQIVLGGDADQRIPVRFEDAAALFFGQYSPQEGAVYVNHQLSTDSARVITIAHELGHAFGLEHVSRDERLSLMNRGNLDHELTASDAGVLEALWGSCADRASGTP
jgi:hypothetical protein